MTLAEALRLMVITDQDLARPRSIEDVVEEVLRVGVKSVQLRSKMATPRTLQKQGHHLRELTRNWGALLFVNDRFDVALAVEADGVHLGPDDIPVGAVRRVAPSGFVIGASTDDPETARQLEAEGADYIGCGAVFPTTTKKDAGEVIGVEGLARVAAAVSIPVVGIGGITGEGALQIARESGAVGVAVIGSVMAAANPGDAASRGGAHGICRHRGRSAASARQGRATNAMPKHRGGVMTPNRRARRCLFLKFRAHLRPPVYRGAYGLSSEGEPYSAVLRGPLPHLGSRPRNRAEPCT